MKYQEYVGQKINLLTILDRYNKKIKNHRRSFFLCRCDCGTEKEYRVEFILNNQPISCGCQFIPPTRLKLIEQRKDRLIVIEEFRKENKYYLKCKCDCGKIIEIERNDFGKSSMRSCGCHRTEKFEEKLKYLNQKFGKLTIIGFQENSYGVVLCKCDCGSEKYIKLHLLVNNIIKTCGCKQKLETLQLVGQKFGRLTILDIFYKNYKSYANCVCECGKKKQIAIEALTSKRCQSCGCLATESKQSKFSKDPQKSSINQLFRSRIVRSKNYGNITLEYFTKLIQQNCFYCNAEPYKVYNKYINKPINNLEVMKNGAICYNGIDRVNTLLKYDINNSIPCCFRCNAAKSNSLLQEWIQSIINIYNNLKNINGELSSFDIMKNNKEYIKTIDKINNFKKQSLTARQHPYLTNVKGIFKHCYDDGDLTLDNFIILIHQDCHYCSIHPHNAKNSARVGASDYFKKNNIVVYNGLDRINSNLTHTLNNVVPCCTNCNKMKSNMTLDEFKNLITNIYNNFIITEKYKKLIYLIETNNLASLYGA